MSVAGMHPIYCGCDVCQRRRAQAARHAIVRLTLFFIAGVAGPLGFALLLLIALRALVRLAVSS